MDPMLQDMQESVLEVIISFGQMPPALTLAMVPATRARFVQAHRWPRQTITWQTPAEHWEVEQRMKAVAKFLAAQRPGVPPTRSTLTSVAGKVVMAIITPWIGPSD